MARKTDIDRAIEKLDAEIEVLIAARERLIRQQVDQRNRKAAATTIAEPIDAAQEGMKRSAS